MNPSATKQTNISEFFRLYPSQGMKTESKKQAFNTYIPLHLSPGRPRHVPSLRSNGKTQHNLPLFRSAKATHKHLSAKSLQVDVSSQLQVSSSPASQWSHGGRTQSIQGSRQPISRQDLHQPHSFHTTTLPAIEGYLIKLFLSNW